MGEAITINRLWDILQKKKDAKIKQRINQYYHKMYTKLFQTLLCIALLLAGCGLQEENQITQIDNKYLKTEENSVQKASGHPQDTVDINGSVGQPNSLPQTAEGDTTSEKEPKNRKETTVQENTENKKKSSGQTASPGQKENTSGKQTGSPKNNTVSKQQNSNKNNSADKQQNPGKNNATDRQQNPSKNNSVNRQQNPGKNNAANKKEDSRTSQPSSQKKDTDKKNNANQTESPSKEGIGITNGTPPEQTPKDTKPDTPQKKEQCTISIECSVILSNIGQLNSSKKAFVPSDGIVLKPTQVTLKEGDTVYDILYRICRKNKIHMEASYTPAYKTYYVEGIHQLYESDCGDLSGWVFQVNGVSPNYGCSKYKVKNGDAITWHYSCDAGKDIG